MLNNIDDVKAFIIWAKSQGIKRIKLSDIEVEISDITIATESEARTTGLLSEERSSSKTLTDTETVDASEEQELLMWSTR